MRFYLSLITLLSITAVAHSQDVPQVTVSELHSRVGNGADTMYVINFWATWCVPCINELPAFEKLNATGNTEKLKVLLVNVDAMPERRSTVQAFVKQHKLQSEVWLLHEANEQSFIDRIDKSWSGAIPATLIIKGNKRRFFEVDFTFDTLRAACSQLQ